MALLEKGLTRAIWALGSLVTFFFGVVGASPPTWAEGVRVAQAEKPAAPQAPAPPKVGIVPETRPDVPERKPGGVIPKLEVGEAIPKLDPANGTAPVAAKYDRLPGQSQGTAIPKLETLPGEPFGTATPKLETLPGESATGGFVKVEGLKGEAKDESSPEIKPLPEELDAEGQLKFDGVDGEAIEKIGTPAGESGGKDFKVEKGEK